ncbi:hypothetical protein PMAYCL1PPCAC_05011, partial [Pristionchus mayeri]
TTDEIKEEPLEFKDEPFDEVYEVKQEEPVINVPPLGTGNEFKEEPLEFKDEPLDDFSDIKREEPIINVRRHICIVCHRICNRSDMRFFTTNQKKRTAWVNGVRSTPEGQMRLLGQLTNHSHLCASHFSHFDAVPFFDDSLDDGVNLDSESTPRRQSISEHQATSNGLPVSAAEICKERHVDYRGVEKEPLTILGNPNELNEEEMELKEEPFDGVINMEKEDIITDV